MCRQTKPAPHFCLDCGLELMDWKQRCPPCRKARINAQNRRYMKRNRAA